MSDIENHLSEDMKRLVERKPYLSIIFESYIPVLKEVLKSSEYNCEVEADAMVVQDKPRPYWNPQIKIITEEKLRPEEKVELANDIRNRLNEELGSFEDTNYNQHKLEDWAKKIQYGIGTEEEFNAESD